MQIGKLYYIDYEHSFIVWDNPYDTESDFIDEILTELAPKEPFVLIKYIKNRYGSYDVKILTTDGIVGYIIIKNLINLKKL